MTELRSEKILSSARARDSGYGAKKERPQQVLGSTYVTERETTFTKLRRSFRGPRK